MKTKLSKKYLFVIALILMSAVLLTSQALAYEAEAQISAPATVNTGALNVRSGPSPSFPVVDVVYQGESVLMLGRTADASWIYIRTPSTAEGWVNIQYLTYSINPFDLPTVGQQPPTSATATPTPQITLPIAVYGIVNTGSLNMRSGPGPQFGVVDTVDFGEYVLLAGRNADGSWVYGTNIDLVSGWMNASYLTLSSPVTVLPVIDGSTPVNPIPPIATIPATAVPPTAIPNTAVVTAGNLNVRSGPGVGYSRIAALGNGEYVTMAGRNLDSTWILIGSYSGQQGWVNSKFLVSGTNITTLPVSAQSGTAHVIAGNLNVRSGAGPGFSVVTVSPYGSSLVMLGRSSDNAWFFVRAGNGKEGWANGNFLSTTMDVNLLPALSGPVPGQPISPIQPIPPVNSGNTASIRSCPNISCPATGTVYSGLSVTATGRTADSTWIYVALSNGQQGWIQAQYVVLGIPISSLPVVTASPTG